MATYNKIYDFAEQLCLGLHHLNAAGDVLKVYLTNVLPTSGMTTKGDLAEITATFGYPTGGTDIANDLSEATGTATVTAVDVTFTASGGSFGPFRYAVVYNDTHATDALVCWWDYGSSISCLDGESFKVDFGASMFTLA